MAIKKGQSGQSAIWDGPLSEKGRAVKPGNSRYGKDCMQILKAPTPYKPGPISSKAQADDGGGWPDSMVGAAYKNPTAQ
tara:strand:- start:55 stop:291 length:237 start_codon:yes stop_codon:yes gene_type:complete